MNSIQIQRICRWFGNLQNRLTEIIAIASPSSGEARKQNGLVGVARLAGRVSLAVGLRLVLVRGEGACVFVINVV